MSDAAPSDLDPTARIGVFDSGVGGLSVLQALRRHLPASELLYVADSGHAPYGERDEAFVVERSRRITEHLLREGAQLVVVACNTATAAAVQALRAEHAGRQFVGVEPGIKPAVAQTRNGRVGVMATRGTLSSEKFRRLAAAHAQGVELHLQPCPGLARAIETGDTEGDEVGRLVALHTEPLRRAGVDTVVLGCTHYPFVAHRIQAALGPSVSLIDTADAVARRAASVARDLPRPAGDAGRTGGAARLWSSGDAALLRHCATRWLDFATETLALPPERAGEARPDGGAALV